MMTTRSSDTQTQTSSQDTQPGWLPHTLSGRTHHSGPRSPCHPPQHPRCQGTNNSKRTQTGDSKQTQTSDRGQRVRLKDCSASSNLAGREARTRPCVGSCEASMDALLSGYPPTASPISHSSACSVMYSSLDESWRAEARVLNLGRTPWHMTWEACDRSAPAVSSTGRACQLEICQ